MEGMSYFMLKNVKKYMFIIDKFSPGKLVVKIPPVLITGILIFSTSVLSFSCKTCKCPAYSRQETNRTNTSNTSNTGDFLFDKRLANAKTGLNQSI